MKREDLVIGREYHCEDEPDYKIELTGFDEDGDPEFDKQYDYWYMEVFLKHFKEVQNG